MEVVANPLSIAQVRRLRPMEGQYQPEVPTRSFPSIFC